MLRSFSALISLLCALPATAAAESLMSVPPVLAVLPLQGSDAVRPALTKLDDELSAVLQEMELYDVTGSYELSTTLAANVPVERCGGMPCLITVGTSVAAAQVLHGEARRAGKKLEVSVRIIDVARRSVARRGTFEVSQSPMLQRRDLERGVRRLLGLPARPVRTSELRFSGRALRADYAKLRRHLLDHRRHPLRRLAAVDAFLEAYGATSSEEISAAAAARRVLASGRDELQAMDDATCAASSDCETRGLCRGGELGCMAKNHDDCRPTYGCKLRGECAAELGACVAAYGFDCEASRECKLKGRCMAQAGTCVVGADVHCRNTAACESSGACTAINGACISAAHARR